MIPYGRHRLHDEDRAALLEVLDSGWLTGGPAVAALEADLRACCGASEVVTCSTGTSALHLAGELLDASPGAWWLVPPATFVASAQAGRYCGYRPVFVDCDPDTGLICPQALQFLLGEADRQGAEIAAVVAVDLNGHPVDIAALLQVLEPRGIPLIRDAAHSLGAVDEDGLAVGADRPGLLATTFSFHPVKLIAAGEGGAIALADPEQAERLRHLRSHAMVRNRERPADYEVTDLGFNHRLSDLHAALGRSQLGRLSQKLTERRQLAACYQRALAPVLEVDWVDRPAGTQSAWHLASVLVPAERRWSLIAALRAEGVGAAHHYPPAHRQPAFAAYGPPANLPGAESYCARQMTLPLFEGLPEEDVIGVVRALAALLEP